MIESHDIVIPLCRTIKEREDGFEIIDEKKCRASGESPLFTSYCCSSCCTSIEEIIERIHKESLEYKLRMSKPHFLIK